MGRILKPQSRKANREHLQRIRTRAGRRKCRRCKIVFNRNRGEEFTICPRCRAHCKRCDVELTEKTHCRTGSRRNQYFCKSCVAETVRNSRDKLKQRDYDLLRNYGITVNEYESMLEDQGGVCWICQNPPKNNRLSVDHRHEKGEKRRNPREKRPRVRGLLCWHCNLALGKFNDDPYLMRRAADYIETCPAQKRLRNENTAT